MRKVRLMSALLSGAVMFSLCPQMLSADTASVAINADNFPDEIFRGYVSRELDTDRNGTLSSGEISNVLQIDIEDLDIRDLTGIRNFTSLQLLFCRSNEITSLDLSGMTTLKTIDCEFNPITSLNVTGDTALSYLDCSHTELTSLDVSTCSELFTLRAYFCHITSIDLSGLDKLFEVYIIDNGLSSIVLDNDKLMNLYLDTNNISSIDLSNCPVLATLSLANNHLTSLDISHNEKLLANLARCEESVMTVYGETNRYFTCIDAELGFEEEYLVINPEAEINRTVNAPIPTTAPVDIPDEPGVSGFVERLYAVALGRTSDLAGKSDWVNAITSGASTGADAARGFLYSREFMNRDRSNAEFVDILYRTFFGREPDQAGRTAWVNALNNGASKEEIIEGFINSTEFANLCVSYGVAGGGTGVPTVNVEPNQATIDFATRLYTTCLNRNADEAGLMAWARQLANQRDSGTGAARGFFFSSEFTSQNVSNGEYVTRLYRTFMGREPDQAGFDAWVGQLNSGVSREEVFNGFAGSSEFGQICASYGIIR